MSLIRHLTRIHLGEDVVEEAVLAELDRHAIRRPLLACPDERLARRLRALAAEAVPAPAAPPGPPREAAARALAGLARAAGCDAILAAGGRDPIELAKAAAWLAAAGRDRALPLLLVAGEAGAGAEVAIDLVVLGADGRPRPLAGDGLVPVAAIFDPTLAAGLGPAATAAHGLEAIARCVEAWLAPGYNPPADAVALDGLARAAGHLPRAVADPGDRTARRELMAAALAAGLASQKGLGAVEAMVRALRALALPVPPAGAVAAALLPPALAFNAPAVGDRPAALAGALGEPTADPAAHLAGLARRLGMAGRLGELGLDPALIGPAAALAEADPASGTNPRRIAEADYRALLRAAW